MNGKFTLRHDGETKSRAISFNPFNQGKRKARVIAIRFRGFMRNHISTTQYDEILKQFIKDLEIYDNKIVIKQHEL